MHWSLTATEGEKKQDNRVFLWFICVNTPLLFVLSAPILKDSLVTQQRVLMGKIGLQIGCLRCHDWLCAPQVVYSSGVWLTVLSPLYSQRRVSRVCFMLAHTFVRDGRDGTWNMMSLFYFAWQSVHMKTDAIMWCIMDIMTIHAKIQTSVKTKQLW